MNDDIELLRRYAEEGSEEAFRDLVSRHIDLVYSAARRGESGPSGVAASVATISLAGATAGAAAAVDGAETIGTIALMTKAQVAVVTAALVVAGVLGRMAYTRHQHSQSLETENAALKAELEVRSTAMVEAKRVAVPAMPDTEREELLRLRGEVARLRSQVATNRQSVGRSAMAHVPRKMERKVNPNRAPGFVPAEQYAFTGYGTPSDALQSHYWALAHPAEKPDFHHPDSFTLPVRPEPA
jgi:hypothetical protein